MRHLHLQVFGLRQSRFKAVQIEIPNRLSLTAVSGLADDRGAISGWRDEKNEAHFVGDSLVVHFDFFFSKL
jgi:hypothetical protein